MSQSFISVQTTSATGSETWLTTDVLVSLWGVVLPTQRVRLWRGPRIPTQVPLQDSTEDRVGQVLEVFRGRARIVLDGDMIWELEAAKMVHWIAREQLTLPAWYAAASFHLKAVCNLEEAGHHLPAWDLMEDVRRQLQLQALVGPTPIEAPPSFWWYYQQPAGTTDLEAVTAQLIVLSECAPDMRMFLLDNLSWFRTWAVIALDPQLTEAAVKRLETAAGGPPVRLGKRVPKVLAKGWYRAGDKKLCHGQPMSIWTSHPIRLSVDPEKGG